MLAIWRSKSQYGARRRVGQMVASAARTVDPAPDHVFLARCAARLALAACISPELARARVQALAISARPREGNHGFEDRCR
jgi:hypothetical protein